MYKTIEEAVVTIASLANHLSHSTNLNKVYVGVPFPFLDRLIQRFGDTGIQFGAQNLNEHEEGAFTGEVSAKMLQSLNCKFVIIGHSERRQYFGETDFLIHQKIIAALQNSLEPIFCCGEMLEERNNANHFTIIKNQIEAGLFELNAESIIKLIIAYEPVWAIGTGLTASAEQAQEMHNFIRNLLTQKYGEQTAIAIPILYGGSVKPNNAQSLFSQPDIDGALVGGASLIADDFIKIIDA